MRLCGQDFSTGIIDRIREVVGTEVDITRSALARRVCGWLDWRTATGQPKEVSGRKALLALEREGLIELPAARARPGERESAADAERLAASVAHFEGSLEALGAVELVAVDAGDKALSATWNALLARYHPLGEGPLCGAQQRYLIRSEPLGWLGGLAFNSAAWHLQARDEWVGWSTKARANNLARVVTNSRFLIVPTVRVPNLASRVLALAAERVAADWPLRYGVEPVLLESFVDEHQYTGSCYRAANWQRVGETAGRGRQDRDNRHAAGRKAVYLLPLVAHWREALCTEPEPLFRRPQDPAPGDWAEQEFGRAELVDGRLRTRLYQLARDFYAQPLAPINQACNGDEAKARAAYRFFANDQVDLQTLLKPHIEATAERIAAHPVVLAAQDSSSLKYTAHPATTGLGPINTRQDGAQGLILHDTLALTPEGTPLGVLDAQCWAREAVGKSQARKALPIEDKESAKWLRSYQRVAAIQALCPNTRLVSMGDREADVYELFELAQNTPQGPDLLVRADRGRQRKVTSQDALWDWMPRQPLAGQVGVHIPGKGGRKARTANLDLRYAAVKLQPPKKGPRRPPIALWAVHVVEPHPPVNTDPVEWLLLTTVAVDTVEQACERLSWYALRWCIEVFHRTLKSGCRIEDRRLGNADSLQACLAIDLVVAWRVYHLTKLGRETPDVPCTVFFREEEWKALWIHHHRTPEVPDQPPTLNEAMRLVAKLGGFLGRSRDGEPGTTALWRGIQRLADIADTYLIMRPAMPAAP